MRHPTIEIVGIATDYCVKCTALDAARLGFATVVRLDLWAAISTDTLAAALRELEEARCPPPRFWNLTCPGVRSLLGTFWHNVKGLARSAVEDPQIAQGALPQSETLRVTAVRSEEVRVASHTKTDPKGSEGCDRSAAPIVFSDGSDGQHAIRPAIRHHLAIPIGPASKGHPGQSCTHPAHGSPAASKL